MSRTNARRLASTGPKHTTLSAGQHLALGARRHRPLAGRGATQYDRTRLESRRSAERSEIGALLQSFEEALEALRIAYEKYFVGVDRIAPVRQLDAVRRQMRNLERLSIRSTQLRFRMENARARFVAYQYYWTRVEREIERGVSRRDLLKVRASAPPPPSAIRLREDVSKDVEPEVPAPADVLEPPIAVPRPGPPPPPAARRGPPPPPPPLPGLDPSELRQVFGEFVRAKQAIGEDVKGITFAAMCRKLASEAPKVLERYKCERVRFEVSTADGRVRLLARPA